MRRSTQLTLEQRYQIQAMLKTGHRYTEIASVVGVYKSTICQEVRCNLGLWVHRPQQAQRLALTRHHGQSLTAHYRRDVATGRPTVATTVESGTDQCLVATFSVQASQL